MFAKMVELMHDHLSIKRSNPFTTNAALPSWLGTPSATGATPKDSAKRKRVAANGAAAK
jgi:hypothetical protein